MSEEKTGGYYKGAIESAKAKDGNADARAEILTATIEYLRSLRELGSLEDVTVDDDGFRVLVLVNQPARGVPAQTWLDAQGAAP